MCLDLSADPRERARIGSPVGNAKSPSVVEDNPGVNAPSRYASRTSGSLERPRIFTPVGKMVGMFEFRMPLLLSGVSSTIHVPTPCAVRRRHEIAGCERSELEGYRRAFNDRQIIEIRTLSASQRLFSRFVEKNSSRVSIPRKLARRQDRRPIQALANEGEFRCV